MGRDVLNKKGILRVMAAFLKFRFMDLKGGEGKQFLLVCVKVAGETQLKVFMITI